MKAEETSTNGSRQEDTLLRNAGMRLTMPRRKMLSEFFKEDHAMSALQLEAALSDSMDRVTVYRILSAFEEKGILHRVQDPDGTTKYALCAAGCTTHEHHDEHLHFHCESCSKTFCLEQVSIPSVPVPEGFRIDQLELRAKGICAQCATQ